MSTTCNMLLIYSGMEQHHENVGGCREARKEMPWQVAAQVSFK